MPSILHRPVSEIFGTADPVAAAYNDFRAQYIRDLENRSYEQVASAPASARSVSEDERGGGCPPLGNTGGKGSDTGSEGRFSSTPETWIAAKLVMKNGKVLEIPGRRGWGGDHAFIDWINFTVDESAFYPDCVAVDDGRRHPVTDDQLIIEVSYLCARIFGFGITSKRDKGAHFYHTSYVLGDDYGMVCYGGQRDTVMVSLSGNGCAAAKDGWEERLEVFLSVSERAKITRIDLTYDDYQGAYTVDQMPEWWDQGQFNAGGRTPDCEQRGNWRKPNGKGRSFYVGSRENGKFCRIYEKGKQLGDAESPWLRFEVEFKSVDRIIPFDVLKRPGEYLAASYPAMAFISERQERIMTKQKSLETTYESMMTWAKRQVGALLWLAKEIEGSADAALEKLMRAGEYPKRLRVPGWDYIDPADQLHNQDNSGPEWSLPWMVAQI